MRSDQRDPVTLYKSSWVDVTAFNCLEKGVQRKVQREVQQTVQQPFAGVLVRP